VHAIITTAGGIEEDIIKSLKPFVLGSFAADGKYLFEKGVNRIGNIFVTNDRYAGFEDFMNPFLESVYKKQKEGKKPLGCSEVLHLLGNFISKKDSYLYWAAKNKIPVYCPAPMDGALGDLFFWHRQRNRDFQLDVVEDLQKIVNQALQAEKAGVIALGGSVPKHFALNAQIFREGCDFAVYVSTGDESDGSDSGAAVDEAVSWGKVKGKALQVKVKADATIVFPLLIAGMLES
jgi:deoxyhypusine synthase